MRHEVKLLLGSDINDSFENTQKIAELVYSNLNKEYFNNFNSGLIFDKSRILTELKINPKTLVYSSGCREATFYRFRELLTRTSENSALRQIVSSGITGINVELSSEQVESLVPILGEDIYCVLFPGKYGYLMLNYTINPLLLSVLVQKFRAKSTNYENFDRFAGGRSPHSSKFILWLAINYPESREVSFLAETPGFHSRNSFNGHNSFYSFMRSFPKMDYALGKTVSLPKFFQNILTEFNEFLEVDGFRVRKKTQGDSK